jgi:ubiquinone/menaquinone biosynthesis C-methylase UbiE
MLEDSVISRVLDVGCGSGQSLVEDLATRKCEVVPGTHRQLIGIDIDFNALRIAKERYPQFYFVCARGEQLPFSAAAIDEVISTIAIPYMDIPRSLGEVRRVLKAKGELRIKLHPLSYTCSELTAELRSGPLLRRFQNLVYRLYVIANGITLNFAGFNFRFPLARRRCESFQTQRGIWRVLAAAGFQKIDTSCWVTKISRPHAGNCRAIAIRGD